MFKPVQRHAPRAQSRFAWPAALALCAALVAGSARAQATLGFEQALRLAQLASRQLASEQAAADAARDMAVAAGQRPDPTLKVGIDNLPVSGPERLSLTRDFMTMRSVSLMQELTRSDKLKARAARFDREAEAADAARALALANLRRDTAIAWLARHYQERTARRAARAAQRGRVADRRGAGRLPWRARRPSRRLRRSRGSRGNRRSHLRQRSAGGDRQDEAGPLGRSRRRPSARCGAGPEQRAVLGRTHRRGAPLHPEIATLRQAAGRGSSGSRHRAKQQALRLERRADVQPAWLGLLEHGVG